MELNIKITEEIKLSYEIFGKGTPLFFLCGGGGTVSYYKPFLEKLEPHFKIIAFDYPGYNQSPEHRAVLDLAYYTKIIGEAIKTFKFRKQYLLAHSLGGGVAISVEAAYPRLIAQTVLMAPMLAQFTGPAPKLALQVIVNSAQSNQKKTIPKENEAIPFIQKNSKNAPEMLKQLDMVTSRFDVPRASAKSSKKLVLLGSDDVVFPLDYQKKLCEDLPNKQIAVFQGHGHDLLFSAQKDVVQAIIDFLPHTV